MDILEGLKLVLNGLVVTVCDDIVMVGDRIYIKSTASVTDGIDTISNSAFARESLTKKGMDDSQITGTASSYARKYALNGLFLIDDTKDADSMDNNTAKPTPVTIHDKQVKNLRSLFNDKYNEKKFLMEWSLKAIQELWSENFDDAANYITEKTK